MNRSTWLQGRRMQKFRDVPSRCERRELSMMEAGELLGMSERQFRRYRDRYKEEGAEGLRTSGWAEPRAIAFPTGRGGACWISIAVRTAAGT